MDVNEVFPCLPVHKFAEGGDIKREFEKQLNKAREEDRRKRQEEDELGASLAEEMEREEQRLLREAQEQESLGLQFARKMWKDMTQTPAPGTKKRHRSVLDMLKSSPQEHGFRRRRAGLGGFCAVARIFLLFLHLRVSSVSCDLLRLQLLS